MKSYHVFVIAILLSSCGTRKRAMQLQEQKIKTLSEKLFKIENDITANVKKTKQYNVLSLEPIDLDKESSYIDPNGNTYTFTNSKLKLDSSKTDSSAILTERSKSETSETSETSENKKNKTVNTESERGDFWRSFSLPVGIGIAVALVLIVWLKGRNQ